MKGDFTRDTFRPEKGYSSVRMQQGRVQLDADWNEQVDIQEHLHRIALRDIIGGCCVPDSEPDSFRVAAGDDGLTIAPGRIYVRGILCQSQQEQTLALPDENGAYVVYLEVWERHLTAIEDPDTREIALGGPDTATRTQTICRPRLAPVEAGTTCASQWSPEGSTSGLLTASTAPEAETTPCAVPARAGYTRLEPQLYRVEVQRSGDTASGQPPTFKWSRDNGSIVTEWLETDGDELVVADLGRDDVLGFHDNRWIELGHDALDLDGAAGPLVEIIEQTPDENGRFRLRIDAHGQAIPDVENVSHPKIRRWDQDDGSNAATGDIDIVPNTAMDLEGGIQVTFSSGFYRSGDYWLIPARTFVGDFIGDILWERDAANVPLALPPHGVERHVCRLAVIQVDDQELDGEPEDCRHTFTSLCRQRVSADCCTAVVRPGEDIQSAIDSLPDEGGCVCVKSGLHRITEPLRIARSNVVIRGEGPGARIRRENGTAVLSIQSPARAPLNGVCVERIRFEVSGGSSQTNDIAMVFTDRCENLCIRDCGILADEFTPVAGVRIGSVFGAFIERCEIGRVFLGVWVDTDSTDLSILDNSIVGAFIDGFDFGFIGLWMEDAFGASRIERNEISDFLSGIYLNRNGSDQPPRSGATGTVIIGNRVRRSRSAGGGLEQRIFGIDVAASSCLVRGNELNFSSPVYGGIRMTGPGGCVEGNRLSSGFSPGDQDDERPIGIQLGYADGDISLRAEAAIIRGNRLAGRQDAIVLIGALSAQVIENDIDDSSIALTSTDADYALVAGNRIVGMGAGIVLVGGEANRVVGNHLQDGGAGIAVGQETALSVIQNRVENMRTIGFYAVQLLGTTHIQENRFLSCGFQGEALQGAISIGVGQAFGQLHIESCEVVNTGISPDGTIVLQPAAGIAAVYVLECLIQGNLVTYTNMAIEGFDPGAEDRALLLLGLLELQVTDNFRIGYAAQIVDNKFSGPGFSSLVEFREQSVSPREFIRFERVTFSNNFCWHWSVQASDNTGTVSLRGRSAIVMGNHVKANTRIPSFDFNAVPGIYIGNDVDVPPIGFAEFPSPASSFNR